MNTSLLPITNAIIEKSYYSDINQEGRLHPLTKALAVCLTATNMNMLFTKQDVFEFLVRIQLVFPFLKIDEHFKSSNHLFCFSENDDAHKMCIEDIYNHIGIRMSNALDNNERSEFINNVNSYAINGLCYAETVSEAFHKVITSAMDSYKLPVAINKSKIAAAEENATLFMNTVENDGFFEVSEKLNDIIAYRNSEKNKKEFDINKIDKKILNEFYEHISTICKHDSIDELMAEDPKRVENLLLIAWLYANKKLMKNLYGEYEVEFAYIFEVDYSAVIIEDGYLPTLNDVIDFYSLNDFAEKLRTT